MFAQGSAKSGPATAPTPKKHRHHSKPHKSTARIADTTTTPSSCTIEADVTVTYSMS